MCVLRLYGRLVERLDVDITFVEGCQGVDSKTSQTPYSSSATTLQRKFFLADKSLRRFIIN